MEFRFSATVLVSTGFPCRNEPQTQPLMFARCGEDIFNVAELQGTGIMLYVGSNTMNCNSWCGQSLGWTANCRSVRNRLLNAGGWNPSGRPQFCSGQMDAAALAGVRLLA